MMGAEDEQVHQSASGWSPIFIEDNLSLMSIGFLLGGRDEAVIWRGPRKNGQSQVEVGNCALHSTDYRNDQAISQGRRLGRVGLPDHRHSTGDE
jgi:hypothetical protein